MVSLPMTPFKIATINIHISTMILKCCQQSEESYNQTHGEQTVRGEEVGGLGKKVKGLNKEKQKTLTVNNVQQYGDYQRKGGWGRLKRVKVGINGVGRR